MKVLHLNLSDYSASGGTGIAAHRLHTGLKKAGHQSKILCLIKQLEDEEDTVYLDRSPLTKGIERALTFLEPELGLKDSARFITTANLRNHPLYKEADVITLHCIHEGFLSYLALPWLTEKPTVFNMHDMWAFTGQCHYSYECDRWKTGCGNCPHPGYKMKQDSSRLEWKLKQWVYHNSKLHIATTGTWMTQKVEKSMLNRFPIQQIPNSIDTHTYKPQNQAALRAELGLPLDKKILMFGALGLKDLRKGGDLLVQALQALPDSLKAETALVTMGREETLPGEVDIPTFNFGFVATDERKAKLYAAADLFLFPTRADNSPLVLIESMACGTPMVSFNVCGVPDTVRPSVTGLLAEPENVIDFKDCIVRLLEDDELRSTLRQKCRQVAEQEYSMELYVQRFVDLYQRAIAAGEEPTMEKQEVVVPS
jgi:glycosyltransferase involved in cell wall biosynthesis